MIRDISLLAMMHDLLGFIHSRCAVFWCSMPGSFVPILYFYDDPPLEVFLLRLHRFPPPSHSSVAVKLHMATASASMKHFTVWTWHQV